jgi:hypothetical protein
MRVGRGTKSLERWYTQSGSAASPSMTAAREGSKDGKSGGELRV